MSRTKKTEVVEENELMVEENLTPEEPATEEAPKAQAAETTDELPQAIENIMKLYPHYEKMWITKQGFVHPEDAPEYAIKDAVLYTNKFFNK